MSLKRPTPVRNLKRMGDSKGPEVKTHPVSARDSRFRSAPRKAADSNREIRIERLKQRLADRKLELAKDAKPVAMVDQSKRLANSQAAKAAELAKANDATFEVTEENFKTLIKEAVGELLRELGMVAEAEVEEEEEPMKEEDAKPKMGDATFEVTEENFKTLIKEAVGELFQELGMIEEEEEAEKPMEELEVKEEEETEIELVEDFEEEDRVEDADLALNDLLKDPKKKEALKALLDGDIAGKKGTDAAAVFTNRYDAVVPTVSHAEPVKIKNRYE